MSRIAVALLLVWTSVCVAADDLTVLKPGPNDPPPRKMLHNYLLKECQTQLAARKEAVEKLKTPAEIATRQADLKAKFITALGGFPEKTPLNAKTVGVLQRDGYRIEKLIYESRPNHHVTANLYVPDGPGPFPGVLMPIGHSQNGKAAEYIQRGCILLVKNGFVVLTYDPIGQGERVQLLDKLGNPAIKGSTSEHTMCGVGALLVGRCTASYRIWDGIRSLDYLAGRPEVDPNRLGCTGCSGGGTLTSYLMALDDRIAAAAPSCYITSLDRLFSTIGPQDAEQNIPGQVAFGMDHADYLFMRAPKPTLICAATRDFFDIQGTWDSFREAKRVYTKLGYPERVEMIESDTAHGYPRSHREATGRFFSRWLKGVDAAITEPDFPIEKDADLLCTRSGHVIEDLKGVSVFDLNAKEADALAKKRAARRADPNDDLWMDVDRLITLGAPGLETGDQLPLVERPAYTVKRWAMRSGSGIPVPVLAFEPKGQRQDRGRGVLHSRPGQCHDHRPGGPVERLLESGRRGMGGRAPRVRRDRCGNGKARGVRIRVQGVVPGDASEPAAARSAGHGPARFPEAVHRSEVGGSDRCWLGRPSGSARRIHMRVPETRRDPRWLCAVVGSCGADADQPQSVG